MLTKILHFRQKLAQPYLLYLILVRDHSLYGKRGGVSNFHERFFKPHAVQKLLDLFDIYQIGCLTCFSPFICCEGIFFTPSKYDGPSLVTACDPEPVLFSEQSFISLSGKKEVSGFQVFFRDRVCENIRP